MSRAPAFAVACPPPGAFTEGRIHGLWVGVLLDFKGEPGGPHAATVYTTTMTPGGVRLTTLGSVEAHGDGAAGLRAMFAGENLYIINSRYAPGSTDQQYEYVEIQRFGIDFASLTLKPEGAGLLSLSALPPDNRTIAPGEAACDTLRLDKALRELIDAGKLERVWTPVTNPAQ